MKRRDMLKGLTALGAAGASGTTLGAGDARAGTPIPGSFAPDAATLRSLREAPLINQAQAARVMEQYDLAGMLAMNPINIYYLSNTLPIGVRMRKEYPAFATLPRKRDEPTFLVTTTTQSWDMANGDRWVPEVIRYTGPKNWQDYTGDNALPLSEEPLVGTRSPNISDESKLTARERGWRDSGQRNTPSPTPEWALARAMRESGITRGRVAVDDMRIARLLQRIGMADNIEFVDGDNLFRRIRYIKSDAEIAYMRIAGRNNCAAAMAAIADLKVGMTLPEIEQRFLAEAAARGNELAFFLAGTSVGSFRNGSIVEGEPFLVDAVSHFQQYHGDFGRTVVVGEPGPEVHKRAMAQSAARDATAAIIRPGVKYSEIVRIGREAFRKVGGPVETFFVSPHSVGLQHTDQPYRDDSPFGTPEDLTLEVGMVITVDLPYLDMGFGAGHHEDLLLITADGFEVLHESPGNLLIV
jgi:Xaa-Pro aminopeptidase